MRNSTSIKTLFILSLLLSNVAGFSQDEEYVIKQPDKKKRKAILFSKLDNPDFTNYFLTASSFTLKSRDIRVSTTDLIFVKGSYGLTNNTTASVNASFFGMIIGSIKHKIDLNESLKLGFSGAIGSLASINEDSTIFYGGGQTMITYGDHFDNITVGTGFYYVKSTFEFVNDDKELSIYNIYLGIQKQVGRRVYLMGDAIYFPNDNIITGGIGVKIIIKERMSLAFGLMPITQEYVFINRTIKESVILPIVSFRMFLDRH